jgi:thiol-disulfide isomerase/thioredoxin
LWSRLRLSNIPAAESDEIAWIRRDGTPGWTVTIVNPEQGGAATAPLFAPVWFAKLPQATVPLAPTGRFDFASARDRVLLLDYWASWCGPCLKELPHLQRLHMARRAKMASWLSRSTPTRPRKKPPNPRNVLA